MEMVERISYSYVTLCRLPPRPGKTLHVQDRTSEYYPDHDKKISERLETYGTTWP